MADHPRQPIMLHGLWRSGSTYVWSKFRASDQTLCFYEPLHEGLASLTREKVDTFDPNEFDRHRHPRLDRSYFFEYRPLIERKGVRHFSRPLSYKRYILEPQEPERRLRRYVESLVRHACSEDKVPVLAFNRAALRMRWLKKSFPGPTVWIDRDPRQLWNSYMAQLSAGGSYFVSRWLLILGENREHPALRPIAHLLPPDAGFLWGVRKKTSIYKDLTARVDAGDLYMIVFYFWLLAVVEAADAADVIVDLNYMAADPAHGRRVGCQLEALTGLNLDFSDLEVSTTDLMTRTEYEALEGKALALVARAIRVPGAAKANLDTVRASLAPERRPILECLLS